MCGLVGMAGDIYANEKKAFKIMHILDITRGEHSSGIFTVDLDKKVESTKAVGLPMDLYFANPKFFDNKGLVGAHRLRVLAGHNRFATQGKITDDNAHPFEFENVIGMHNGTLYPTALDKYPEAKDAEVDSEGLFKVVSTKKPEEFKEIYKNVGGAMALVWWDKRDSSINFIRNKDRPLYWSLSADKKTVFWASEPWMLNVGLGKAGIKNHTKPEIFPENLHCKYFPMQDEAGVTITKNSVEVKLEGYSPNFGYYRNGVYVPYDQGWLSYSGYGKGSSHTKEKPNRSHLKGSVFRYYNSEYISKEEMEEKLAKIRPCAVCDKTPHIEDAKNLLFFTKDEYMCESCSQDPEYVNIVSWAV